MVAYMSREVIPISRDQVRNFMRRIGVTGDGTESPYHRAR